MGWGGYRTHQGISMQEGIHPEYREVCFVDLSNGFKFVTRSCVNTKETVKMDDGRELPLFKLDTSSESHPFYTGVWSASATATRPPASNPGRRPIEGQPGIAGLPFLFVRDLMPASLP